MADAATSDGGRRDLLLAPSAHSIVLLGLSAQNVNELIGVKAMIEQLAS